MTQDITMATMPENAQMKSTSKCAWDLMKFDSICGGIWYLPVAVTVVKPFQDGDFMLVVNNVTYFRLFFTLFAVDAAIPAAILE